jgi:hypothetical protein
VGKQAGSDVARQLKDLDGVGPATLRDFDELGIRNVDQLAKKDPRKLYTRLCRIKGVRIDPCCLDGFTCAVAQARDPFLPAQKRKWRYWSRVRKSGRPAGAGAP